MIETNLVHEDIVNNEPILQNHLHDSQVDYQTAISTAYGLMVQDVKNQNHDIRKLCKRLYLQETEKTVTAETYNGATSKEDRVERLRWVIKVTALTTNPATFALQGKNKTSDSWTTIKTVIIDNKGIHKFKVLEVRPNVELEIYKYYRIQKTDSTSTLTFTSYLVETTYENLHLWRSLALIFEDLVTKGEDIFRSKADKYLDMYDHYLVNNKYYYDSEDDGEIGEVETESDYRRVVLRRG